MDEKGKLDKALPKNQGSGGTYEIKAETQGGRKLHSSSHQKRRCSSSSRGLEKEKGKKVTYTEICHHNDAGIEGKRTVLDDNFKPKSGMARPQDKTGRK